MKVTEAANKVGQIAYLLTECMKFPVLIRDCKHAYGKMRFQISPASGAGMKWVDEDRLSFDELAQGKYFSVSVEAVHREV